MAYMLRRAVRRDPIFDRPVRGGAPAQGLQPLPEAQTSAQVQVMADDFRWQGWQICWAMAVACMGHSRARCQPRRHPLLIAAMVGRSELIPLDFSPPLPPRRPVGEAGLPAPDAQRDPGLGPWARR